MEQVTKADRSFQKNHYDAEGLRAEMEENGQLVKFLYNEDRERVFIIHDFAMAFLIYATCLGM